MSFYFCQDPNIPQTPEAEEEDRILESYLMNMKIDQSKLKLPPTSELPDGFELFLLPSQSEKNIPVRNNG